ncbi:TonB-dependent receptor domain-containing protein [Bacteroidota bacterium]
MDLLRSKQQQNQLMQIRLYILTALLLMVGKFALAQEEVSLLERKISLEKQTTTLGQALSLIGERAGFTFSYGNRIPVDHKVTIQAREETVQKILDDLFIEVPVDYIEKNDKILIVPKKGSSNVSQTVRGRVVDKDSKEPIPGVNVYIASPLIGTITDPDGNFRINHVPVGRHSLQVSCMGYEGKNQPNIVVRSGKETILEYELEESFIDINEVTILYEPDKLKPVNELAVISAMALSPEDLTYSPGSLNDISRAAVSLPGVASSNDGQNHLIIRGNSPKGLQWRLEGIEVPNMNHFAEIGSSGGGVNILSNNMIGRSDFYTGAFPAEYGNALSGVFDLNLRTGNNEKHEQTFQLGVIGTEFMAEGPLNQNSGASYIAQFRYSTLMLPNKIGLIENVPEFGDLSFKIHLPSNRLGSFSIFGIGGKSHEKGPPDYHWYSDMGTLGISHNVGLNQSTRIKTILALSAWKFNLDSKENIGSLTSPIDYHAHNEVKEYTPQLSVTVDKKISPKHKIRGGLVYLHEYYDSYMGWRSDTLSDRALDTNHPLYSSDIQYQYTYSNAIGNTGTFQTFLNWRYRIYSKLTLNSGLHYLHLFLNSSSSLEPRFSLSWQFAPRHNLSAGFGIHSRRESYTLLTGSKTLHDGEQVRINQDLELSKSRHYVIGYQFLPQPGLLLKAEAYYQYLYDIPVYPFPPYFSTMNFDMGFEGNILVNRGSGFNKGMEFTIDKLFSNGYSFLITGTLYDSKYRNYMGEEYHTKYNGTFASSGMFSKEIILGSGSQNVLGMSGRIIWTGGFRERQIDMNSSIASGREVRIWDYGFTEKLDNYFRTDILVYFRRNRHRYSGEWKLEILNLTNNKNMLRKYYDNSTQSVRIEYQNPLIPVLTYRIQF